MRASAILLLAALLAGCAQERPATAEEDPAAGLIASIERIQVPVLNPSSDPLAYQAKYDQAWRERSPLVLKLLNEFPDHPKTAKLMDEYWQSLMKRQMSVKECEAVIEQIKKTRAASTNKDLRQHAAFWTTFYSAYRDREDVEQVLAHADGFSHEFPMDARGATIYSFASMSGLATKEEMKRALASLVEKYPTTEDGAFARAMLPLLDNVGKTFDFDFTDAVTGARHTDEKYRGKVLVIDWWATWCGPCIASLPRMRALHEKYKDKGLEFIGVSLDEPEARGGLEALRTFVRDNEMPWPQFHLDGDPAFQQKYRVSQIPTVFVVDRSGTIVSIDGYRTLERTLESLFGA
jgi:thiol-disulfide isomerase/thioredoxin